MNIKKEAYRLHLDGLSYKQIASNLAIGKTTAYNYVKEIKTLKAIGLHKTVQNRSEPGIEPNSERAQSNLERSDYVQPTKAESFNKEFKLKEFTGHDLLNTEFDCLEFEGKFLELIGKPSRKFSAIIWGLPKGGKSNLALRFADYLQEYFGKAVYIAAEEGESVTLQEKFRDIGGSNLTVVESRNREEIRHYLKQSDSQFIFIDSINTAAIDNDYLEQLKEENPEKSFVAITQATKGGNFKGDQALTHNCDFVIKVVDGVAYHHGRFNQASEIKIFEEPLYEKNKAFNPEFPKNEKAEGEKPLTKFPTPALPDLPFNSKLSAIDSKPNELKPSIPVNQQKRLEAEATLISLVLGWGLQLIMKAFKSQA